MSTASTTAARAGTAGSGLRSALGWIAGGVLAAGVVAVLAIALWPASEADKARDDGEQLGQAVTQLYYADSSAEVDAALAEVHQAAVDTREHAGDAVATQVADQEDALARAADGFIGSVSADDEFEADLYQAELDVALDDLERQASDFQNQGPEVRQAFWEGYEDGLSIE
jgi:hypothetical protein